MLNLDAEAIQYILANFVDMYIWSYINSFVLDDTTVKLPVLCSDTLPYSPIQTIALTNNAVDLDMTENGDYLYVTDFRLGVKVFYKQNGVF